jgi:hypothetical protein
MNTICAQMLRGAADLHHPTLMTLGTKDGISLIINLTAYIGDEEKWKFDGQLEAKNRFVDAQLSNHNYSTFDEQSSPNRYSTMAETPRPKTN